ncbi:C97 family peptidase, partial [bacterium]|nr:C97 family peptidase [bacterium]
AKRQRCGALDTSPLEPCAVCGCAAGLRGQVYDLMPPCLTSDLLWLVGLGLHHSAVEVYGNEYSFGGHEFRHDAPLSHLLPPSVAPA